jgi:hypothetical protein
VIPPRLAGLEGEEPSRSAPDRVGGRSRPPLDDHSVACHLDPQPDLTRVVEPSEQPRRRLVPDRLIRDHVVHDEVTVRQSWKLKHMRKMPP